MENTISLYDKGTGYNREGINIMEFNTPVLIMEIYLELDMIIWIFVICGDWGDIVDIGLRFWFKEFYGDFYIMNV